MLVQFESIPFTLFGDVIQLDRYFRLSLGGGGGGAGGYFRVGSYFEELLERSRN